MTPELALKRAGHRFPRQILDDLKAEGFEVFDFSAIEAIRQHKETVTSYILAEPKPYPIANADEALWSSLPEADQ